MPSVYQMAVHGLTPQGNYWATIWHFTYPDATELLGISAAKDVASWFGITGGAAYQDVLPIDTQIKGVNVRRVSDGGGPTWSQPFEHVGIREGTVQAAGICPDISWFPGEEPWSIGHTYVPGVTSDDLDEGEYSDGFKTAIDTFIGVMVADDNVTESGASIDLCLFNAKETTFNLVITGQLKPKPTLMNRRLRPVTT